MPLKCCYCTCLHHLFWQIISGIIISCVKHLSHRFSSNLLTLLILWSSSFRHAYNEKKTLVISSGSKEIRIEPRLLELSGHNTTCYLILLCLLSFIDTLSNDSWKEQWIMVSDIIYISNLPGTYHVSAGVQIFAFKLPPGEMSNVLRTKHKKSVCAVNI